MNIYAYFWKCSDWCNFTHTDTCKHMTTLKNSGKPMFLSWNINDNSISPRSEHSVQVREAEREHDKRANPTPPCPDQNILHHLSSLVHSARRLAVLCSTWRIMQNRSCSSQNPFLPRSEHTSAFLLTWQSAVVVPSFRIMAKPQLYQHPFLSYPTSVWWQH